MVRSLYVFFFSSRRRHTRCSRDWSSDVCSSDLHNRNRPRPGGDSYERTIQGINVVRGRLGRDRVSALMTTTEASLTRARDIIDEYLVQGFNDILDRKSVV